MPSGGGPRSGRSSRVRSGLFLAALAVVLCTACTPDGQAPPPKQTSGAAPGPATLSLAVYGPPAVLEAYRGIATGYADRHADVAIDVQGHRDQDTELADVRARTAAGNPPDLFLVDHAALPEVLGRVWRGTDRGRRPLNQPVDELLGQRHLPFGDGYNRAGLEAFSANARLQCMPVELSPMVVYYNTDLLHLGRVAQPGDDPVNPENGWSTEEFARAARLASTGRARGVAVAAGLEQVAPFVWSGGGELVDDPRDPTTTTLSDGASTGGLRQLLEIVRSPRLAVTPAQLVHRSAVQRFRAGRVGMVLGYRDLTPRLRTAGNLHFDVMPMPGHPRSRTIGSARALCLHRDSRQVDRAADLLAHMVSDHDSEALARTGYVMPSNLDAVNSPAFLQPARQPAHARVFDAAVRAIEFLPAGDRWRKAATMVDRALAQLWTRPVIDPLEKRLDAIDRRSRTVLAPQSQESGQP